MARLGVAMLAAALLLPVAAATEVPPGYVVEAIRDADRRVFHGLLSDVLWDGSVLLWVSSPAAPGFAQETVSLRFQPVVERTFLSGDVVVEEWTTPGGGKFRGMLLLEPEGADVVVGDVLTGTGQGKVAGFTLVAHDHTVAHWRD